MNNNTRSATGCPFMNNQPPTNHHNNNTHPNNNTNTTNKSYNRPKFEDEKSFLLVRDQFHLSLKELLKDSIGKWRTDNSLIQSYFMDINDILRRKYNHAQEITAVNIYPIIVASEIGNPSVQPTNNARQGIGGTYTLYLSPTTVYTRNPVHKCYELLKICSHIIIGIFTITEPYLNITAEHTINLRFINDLQNYYCAIHNTYNSILSQKRKKCTNHATQHSTETLSMHDEILWNTETDSDLFFNYDCKKCIMHMLHMSYNYCSSVLTHYKTTNDRNENENTDKFLWHSFNKYAQDMKPLIRSSMKYSTDLQARGVIQMLIEWRNMMSDEQWRDMYLIIPAVWVTSKNSCREQCFRFMMDSVNQDTHIIVGENLPTLFEARKLVGRVIHDRFMSRIIFGIEERWSQRKCQGLGSQTDSLSDYSKIALETIYDELMSEGEKSRDGLLSKL